LTRAQKQLAEAWHDAQSVLPLHGQVVTGVVAGKPPQVPLAWVHVPAAPMPPPAHQPHVAVPTHVPQVVGVAHVQAAVVLLAVPPPPQVPAPTQPLVKKLPEHHSQPLAALAAHELQSALAEQLTVGHVSAVPPPPVHVAVVRQRDTPRLLQKLQVAMAVHAEQLRPPPHCARVATTKQKTTKKRLTRRCMTDAKSLSKDR